MPGAVFVVRQGTVQPYLIVKVMIINKRKSIRKRLNLYVQIYSFEGYVGMFKIRDIDLNGAFITNCGSRIHPEDVLELQLRINDGERNPLRLRATVTRVTDQGMAVLFDYDVQEYRRLLNLLSIYASNGHALKVPGFWYLSSEKGQE